MADSEGESDEEIDVLSNINDQNRTVMFVGTHSSKFVPQTTHPLLAHVGGGLQRQKEQGLNSRNDEESESDESDSSSESESDSEDEEEEEEEEDDDYNTASAPPPKVLHIRDIHPIKPSEDDLSLQDQEDLTSPDPSPNLTTSNGAKKTRFWEEDPEIYGIRRSGRQRKEPERFNVMLEESNDEETIGPVRKKKKTNTKRRISSSEEWPTEGNDSSGSDSSDSYTPQVSRPRPKPRARARAAPIQANSYIQQRLKAQQTKRTKIKEPAPDSEASDSDDDVSRSSSLRKAALNITSYKEESEDDTDSEDVLEGNGDWQGDYVEDDREMIERILDSRQGRSGEIGAITTVYAPDYEEFQKRGLPDPEKEETEEQFLIKWKGWSHLHSTWESQKSLVEQNVKGMKKLENFMKREKDIRIWKKQASPEDIEYFEVQQQLNSDLIEEYHEVERIIAHTTVANTDEFGNTVNQVDYLCKWNGMPYGECTWEDGSLVSRFFQDKIDAYLNRERSDKIPTKSAKVLRQRPKFSLIKKQPSYVGSIDKLRLRDYQLDGLNWLVNSWCKGNSTILADEMGLGKTIQVISFLSYLFHSHTLYGPFLIVVPLSTMAAWQREFAAWAPQLNVVVYLGDVTSRTKIREYEFYHKNKKLKINALLSTYEIILKDKHILGTFNWAGLVVDEAHRLKNDDSLLYKVLQEFHTNHRLLVTGTPLQNSLKELWALLHFLMPDRFASWEAFEHTHSTQEQKDKGFAGLHKELEPYLLRRVKKDVEKSLPAKVEQILRVEMSSVQKQYYRWILTKNFRALNKGLKGNANSFLNIMMELKKCCNHASLIRPLENPLSTFDPLQDLIRGSGKLFLLDKLLVRLKETGHRVLIFSQMVRMLDILAEYLQRRRFLFQRLDGSIRGDVRKKALDHFNAEGSEDFCFLLSTRAGGLGINLATADTVIIFDSDWNPQNDLQAQARAHRIGQRNQVNIYRLVSKGSVEEDIIERAKRKMVLDHLVIQRMDTTGRKVLSKTTSAPPSSNTPFNKDELSSILKFGAEDLFKEGDGEQDSQLQEMDIDDILRRAELRTSDDQPQTVGEELLSQFKMANFAIDEESINTPEPSNSNDTKTWEEIIPDDVRQKIDEEEKQKEQLALYLPPRARKAVNKMNYDSEGEPASRKKPSKKKKSMSDTEDEGSEGEDRDTKRKRGRPRTIKREDIEGFNDSEIRKFVKSYKKFGRPRTRLDAIASDAELDDKPKEDIERLSMVLHDGCLRAVKEYNEKLQEDANFDGKKRGATLRIGNVTINAPSILKHEEELEPLAVAIPADTAERKKYRLTFPAKSVHWGVPWDVSDDSMLLLGIYEHGMGNWEAIKADEGLELSSKILPPGNLKPQDKHLQTRAEYLIKLLKQVMQESKAEELRKSSATLKTRIKRIKKKDTKKNAPSTDVSPGSSAVPSPAAVASPKVQPENKQGGEAGAEMTPQVATETKQKSKKKENSNKKGKKKAKKEEKPAKEEKEKKEKKEKKAKKETKEKEEQEKKESSPVDENRLPVSSPESKHDNHAHVNSYSADQMDKDTFDACKEKMRPVKRALKMLESPEQDVEAKDQVAQTRQCLLKIGDHIMDMTSQYKDHDVASEWRGNLWTFVSKFTAFEAKKLYKLYRHALKKREETRQQHQQERSHHKHGQSASKNGKPAAGHSGQRSQDLKRPLENVSLPGSSSKIPKLETSRPRFGLDSDDSHRAGHGYGDKSKERSRDGHDDRRRYYDRDRFSSHYDHPKTPDRPSDYSRTHERSSDHSRTKDQYSRSYDRVSDHHSRSYDKNYTKPYDKRMDHRDDHYRSRDYSFEHRHHSYSHRTSSESSHQSLTAHSPLDGIHSSPRPAQDSRKHYSDDKHRDKRS